jgi:hypothetical protein
VADAAVAAELLESAATPAAETTPEA